MWYNKVTSDLTLLPDFISYYEGELESAKKETSIKGNVEQQLSMLPGVTEHRFNQLQEIEAMLEYLNIQLRKTKRAKFKQYLEKYNKALSSRDAEKYADGDDEVIELEELKNEVALLRNKYMGIMKALESKNFMLGHIVRLRAVGMEDIIL